MQLYIKYKNTIVWKSHVRLIDMRRGELPAVIVGLISVKRLVNIYTPPPPPQKKKKKKKLKKQTHKQQQQQQPQNQRISRLAVALVVLCVLLA